METSSNLDSRPQKHMEDSEKLLDKAEDVDEISLEEASDNATLDTLYNAEGVWDLEDLFSYKVHIHGSRPGDKAGCADNQNLATFGDP